MYHIYGNNKYEIIFSYRAKDFKSRAANLIRRRTTEATLSEKSLIPSREDVQSWEQSFDALLRHRCKNFDSIKNKKI
jgi:hypothetical protein